MRILHRWWKYIIGLMLFNRTCTAWCPCNASPRLPRIVLPKPCPLSFHLPSPPRTAVINVIVLTGALGSAYAGVNILYSFICLFVLAAVGMAAAYKNYHGFAESSGRSKTIARVLMLLLFIPLLIEAFGNFGNINGLASFGGTRFAEAEALCV
jgi:hypothetical protein